MLYKLLATEIFPNHDWIICSDVDVLFKGDISDSRKYIDDDNYIYGFRPPGKLGKYYENIDMPFKKKLLKGIGAGYLVFNLKKMRIDGIQDKFIEAMKKHGKNLKQAEQDIINIVLEDNLGYLPLKYCFCTYMYNLYRKQDLHDIHVNGNLIDYFLKKYKRNLDDDEIYSKKELLEAFENPVQIHYATDIKPWNTIITKKKIIWLYYLFKTPFFKSFIKNRVKHHYVSTKKTIRKSPETILNKIASRSMIFKKIKKRNTSLIKNNNNLKNKIKEKNKLLKKLIEEKIAPYTIIHIMDNYNFNKPIIDLFNKYSNEKKHFFIFTKYGYSEEMLAIPDYENVLKVHDLNLLLLDNAEKIIFHGLFSGHTIKFLYNNSNLLKKSYWAMWGGDFYFTKETEISKFVKGNFKGYLNLVPKDFEIAKKKYDFKGESYFVSYLSPVSTTQLDNSRIKSQRNFTSIQINHSADASIIEMLNDLKKFKDEQIKIKVILSCGDTEYNDEIISLGEKIYGDKFFPILDYMSPKEYADVLADTNILILNQNRQQGLGNIFGSLYLGAKVYVKGDVGTYDILNDFYDINIYDTYNIKNESFKEFLTNDFHKENSEKSKVFFDESEVYKKWEKVFKS